MCGLSCTKLSIFGMRIKRVAIHDNTTWKRGRFVMPADKFKLHRRERWALISAPENLLFHNQINWLWKDASIFCLYLKSLSNRINSCTQASLELPSVCRSISHRCNRSRVSSYALHPFRTCSGYKQLSPFALTCKFQEGVNRVSCFVVSIWATQSITDSIITNLEIKWKIKTPTFL